MNLYDQAMEARSQDEADRLLEELVKACLAERPEMSRQAAEEMQRENIGYIAGYYSNETRERVEKLFHCAHPIFGAIAEKGPPSAEEAFRLGHEMGREIGRHADGVIVETTFGKFRITNSPCGWQGDPL